MSPRPRFVFDTSVLVSALLIAESVPGQALHAAIERGEILTSEATLTEIHDVLRRPKFDRYVTWEDRERFLTMFVRDSVLVEVTQPVQACRDPKDDRLLEVAVNGQATCLITGDEDLLELHPFRGISILPPAKFLETLS